MIFSSFTGNHDSALILNFSLKDVFEEVWQDRFFLLQLLSYFISWCCIKYSNESNLKQKVHFRSLFKVIAHPGCAGEQGLRSLKQLAILHLESEKKSTECLYANVQFTVSMFIDSGIQCIGNGDTYSRRVFSLWLIQSMFSQVWQQSISLLGFIPFFPLILFEALTLSLSFTTSTLLKNIRQLFQKISYPSVEFCLMLSHNLMEIVSVQRESKQK